ncbi:MAG: pentapeptide repeat-containing protein [Elainellaceae cyanobacterium]
MSRDALVVGINSYTHLKSLNASADHAAAIAQRLAQEGGFQRVRQLPTGANPCDVSQLQLKQALRQLFCPSRFQIPDTALLYFSGHGRLHQDDFEKDFLATSDTDPSRLHSGLSLRWLQRLLSESPVKQRIIWIDCGSSGCLVVNQNAATVSHGEKRDRCLTGASRGVEPLWPGSKQPAHELTPSQMNSLDFMQQQGHWMDSVAFANEVNQMLREELSQPIRKTVCETTHRHAIKRNAIDLTRTWQTEPEESRPTQPTHQPSHHILTMKQPKQPTAMVNPVQAKPVYPPSSPESATSVIPNRQQRSTPQQTEPQNTEPHQPDSRRIEPNRTKPWRITPLKIASWLLIPAVVMGGVVEAQLREHSVKAAQATLDGTGEAEKQAVEALVQGCRKPTSDDWMPTYVLERFFGNCRPLARASLQNADLRAADLSNAYLRAADLSLSNLRNADLHGTNLHNASLHTADLSDADLHGTNLRDANLHNTNLSNANLHNAILRDTVFRNANLRNADLSAANLSTVYLRFADLHNADLSDAYLRNANLSDANFSSANFSNATLSDANFSNTVLDGAILLNTDFRDARHLTLAQFTTSPAPLLCNVALPAAIKAQGVDPNRDCDAMPQVLSDRHNISLTAAQQMVDYAHLKTWD